MSAAANIPIVLLPGMDGTGELLGALADRLSSHRPAHVISYPTNPPMGYDALTTFVMARAPEGRFIVLGESFSGPIAIEVAAREPHRVAGLILASSFARSPMPAPLAGLARMINPKWIPYTIAEAVLLGAGGTPALRASLRQALSRLPSDVLQLRAAELVRVDKRDRLCKVSCPVLCLQGRFDRLVGKRCTDEITSAQPRCEVHWLDAPHMLLETHADEAAEVIAEFSNRLN